RGRFRVAWDLRTDNLPEQADRGASDQCDCASFGSQESAQVELDSDPSDPNNLDFDGNGRACDNYPPTAPAAA
ncbi:MAG TPA: hypothetical protein VE691_17695, partial [Rubrobacter sp.]|nr:hypothetical protein [Rubrobacter sp.]